MNTPKKTDPSATKVAPVPAFAYDGFGRELANWLFPGFLLFVLLGFFLIYKFGMPPGNPNSVRALFIAMNAATLSGFNPSGGMASLTLTGQAVALLLIIGGSLFSMIVGSLAVVRICRLEFTDAQIVVGAFIVEAAALLGGTIALWESGKTFDSLFLAASAFGNCGLYIANLPGPTNVLVHAVILPLGILGGLGLPVLMELGRAIARRGSLSKHSQVVLSMSAWVYIIGFILILLLSLAGHGWPTGSSLMEKIPASSILAIESRTGGLSIADPGKLANPGQWILVLLMMIGASPAGTASGLKTTTLGELIRGGPMLLRGQTPPRSFAVAFVWLMIYLGLLLISVLLLSYVGGATPADHILFNAASALSNVGFTAIPLPDQKNLMFAYSAILLLGRMAPLMVLWWMAEITPAGAEADSVAVG